MLQLLPMMPKVGSIFYYIKVDLKVDSSDILAALVLEVANQIIHIIRIKEGKVQQLLILI